MKRFLSYFLLVIIVSYSSITIYRLRYNIRKTFYKYARYVKDVGSKSAPALSFESYDFKESDVYGIDVSHYQKSIDWSKVSKNTNPRVDFVYIKSSEGVTVKDKRFKYNYKKAKSNGLRVGVYHFFSPTTTGRAQFEAFRSVYPRADGDLPVMIDCERMGNSSKNYHKELKVLLDLCKDYYGAKPLIYSTQRFYNTYLKNKVNAYQIMIGRYNQKRNQPQLLDNRSWDIWQFSDKGKIDGISEHVDIDLAKTTFWK